MILTIKWNILHFYGNRFENLEIEFHEVEYERDKRGQRPSNAPDESKRYAVNSEEAIIYAKVVKRVILHQQPRHCVSGRFYLFIINHKNCISRARIYELKL